MTEVIRRKNFIDPRVSAELRAIRVELGISGEQAARHIGWSHSKISRYECGKTPLRVASVQRVLDFYVTLGLDRGRSSSVMALTERGAARAHLLDERLATADLACSAQEWAPLAVPKLLQVPSYTAAVLDSWQRVLRMPPGEVREIASSVRRWQELLDDDPPLQVRAVIDESVLYRRPGAAATADVMRGQLHHLDRIGSQAGTDTGIRILPLDRGGPAGIGQFTYLTYPEDYDVPAPAAVLVDDLDGLRVLPLSESGTWQRHLIFDQLWDMAEAPGPLIKRALADAWPETART